ncbi:MAG: (2Fe-2S)-binding protein [Oscillospiraceae bacterium]|jgi:carbon-monoxide dehydrogenase small subunit|nr:(2Fe-2S)-binding protein [Oscillospiraceae bacterium]
MKPETVLNADVRFTLNGKAVAWLGSPAAPLLDVLREGFGNTGVKCGCREGECGACAVILDGELVNSCMVAAGRASGAEIVTIEGYKNTPGFEILDRAFAGAGAVQCGFCTPGMILAAACILRNNPHPTTEEVRKGISGNLCRCTGYNAIVTAILAAAGEGEGKW